MYRKAARTAVFGTCRDLLVEGAGKLSRDRNALNPSMSKGRRGMSSRGSVRSVVGMSASARFDWSSSDAAATSDRSLARNTPFTTRRWFERPSRRSSSEVRAASLRAPVSGRATRMMVVDLGSLSASIAALKRASCILSPECGPRSGAAAGRRRARCAARWSGNSARSRHPPRAPMGGSPRHRLQRLHDHRLDLGVVDHAWHARARLII